MLETKNIKSWNIFASWLPPQEENREMYSWDILDEFVEDYKSFISERSFANGFASLSPQEENREMYSWDIFDEFVEDYKSFISERYEVLDKLLKNWNDRLKDLNGDSTYHNWSKFRPLRLSREEDWSDWLAHLIETSKTGDFCRFLFKLDNISDFSESKEVHRELSSDNYRADIIIEWKNDCYSHVEVKINDKNLSKTYKTRQEMMKKFEAEETKWTDFILLLPDGLSLWEASEEASNKIIPLSWEDVAIALRQALLGKETIVWKVWSWSFLGAIEQRLIKFPGHEIETKPEQNLETLETKIKILSDGLKKGYEYE